jgi:hypothetical protein
MIVMKGKNQSHYFSSISLVAMADSLLLGDMAGGKSRRCKEYITFLHETRLKPQQ